MTTTPSRVLAAVLAVAAAAGVSAVVYAGTRPAAVLPSALNPVRQATPDEMARTYFAAHFPNGNYVNFRNLACGQLANETPDQFAAELWTVDYSHSDGFTEGEIKQVITYVAATC